MIRLCNNCKRLADKYGVLEKVFLLCRRYMWLCPSGRIQCGAVDGRTQDSLRDDLFLEAIAEMCSEKEPERMN